MNLDGTEFDLVTKRKEINANRFRKKKEEND